MPKAGLSRANEWLQGSGARWNGNEKTWLFPSGAKLVFGYLETENDKYRYRTAEFNYIAFDELTSFTETQYRFLFSRLRRLRGSSIPMRMRSATNPGGPGHQWVKKRFVCDEFLDANKEDQFSHTWLTDGRLFIPARLEDNFALDVPEYELSMAQLDPVEREQMRHGDWKAHAGGRFRPEWWGRYTDLGDAILIGGEEGVIPKAQISKAVIIDPAASKNKTSKYTAIGVFGDIGFDRMVVLDVVREQLAVEQIVPRVELVCKRNHPIDWVGFEANGFQVGLVNEARDDFRYPDIPLVMELSHENKGKLTRAQTAIMMASQGRIYLPDRAPWVDAFIAECSMFTGNDKEDTYTDQVDILAYSARELKRFGAIGEDALPAGVGRRPGPFHNDFLP